MPESSPPAAGLLSGFAAWRRRRLGLRGLLLYFVALPLPLAAVVALAQGRLDMAFTDGLAFAVLVLGANLNRRGLREELLAPERRFTESPRMPYKPLAGGLVGLATLIAAYAGVGQSLAVSLVFAALALVGFHLAYGLLPARRRGEVGPGRRTGGRVGEALARAENQILQIEFAAASVGNEELQERLQRIGRQARAILDLIAERPDELFRARKFLSVYLEGAQKVSSRYVKTHRLARSRVLENNFRKVLVEIEQVFEQQQHKLMQADLMDLDVQIEVLRKQMEREGIA